MPVKQDVHDDDEVIKKETASPIRGRQQGGRAAALSEEERKVHRCSSICLSRLLIDLISHRLFKNEEGRR